MLKQNQQGISLFIVMVVVLLTAILVAMGFKSSLFNETATGNSVEYQRTFEAAQALMHDAEMDIYSQTPSGALCGGANCRANLGAINDADSPGGTIYFPSKGDQLSEVMSSLMSSSVGCIAGVCRPLLDASNQPEAFWDIPTRLASMKKRAASYGRYTDGVLGARSNQRLKNTNSWYWVEILPYVTTSGVFGGTALAPTDIDAIFRITVLVEGERNTRSVLQKIVVGKSSAI